MIGATVGRLPEIIEDAGLLADPTSVEAIAAQIARMMTDDALHKACAEKGLARAKLFSWDKAARECLELYETILKD